MSYRITCSWHLQNFEECSIVEFNSNWAYSWAWGSLNILVGRSSTSFPFIGSSFKFKPKWTFLPHAKSANSTMMYFSASTITRLPIHIFFNMHFLTSKIQTWNGTWPNSFGASSFLVIHVHHPWQIWQSNLQVKSWTSSSCLIWFWDWSISTLANST